MNIVWEALLIIFSVFISLFAVVFFVIFNMMRTQRIRIESRLAEERMSSKKERAENALEVWDEVRKMRHDIKQHLSLIDGYLARGDYDGCRAYLNKLLPEANGFAASAASDNTVIDYIISSKLLSRKDIDSTVQGSIGDLSDISDSDLACLLGNILDNAVEAVDKAKEKRIELTFLRHNSNRVIICKNTVQKSVLASNRELATTKKEAHKHGLGTRIMGDIVAEHNGVIDYYEEDGMFVVTVILPPKKK